MKFSALGLKNNKIVSVDKQFPIQDILVQSGQLEQFASGIYGYGHIPFLVKNNIKKVISDTMTCHGASELSLPLLQPESLWVESGRLERYVKDGVMFRSLTEHGNYCLAPTAEEAVVGYARERLLSYKDIPVTYFQIGEKFRDELRCRGYLLRGKSFEMFDAYSFGKNIEDLMTEYDNMKTAYFEIFEKLGLETQAVSADNGAIGGSASEEFMLVSDIGEDNVLIDEEGHAFNSELLENESALKKLGITNTSNLKTVKAVELGHIFALGDKYSKSMKGTYIDEKNQEQYYQMGCYGIGVSRTLAMVYENAKIVDEKGNISFSLPLSIAPYLVYIVASKDDQIKYLEAEQFYDKLLSVGVPAIIDDSNASIGAKIKNNNIVGCPYMIVFGNKSEENKVEVENNKTKEKMFVETDKLIRYFEKISKDRTKNLEEFLQN